MSQILVTMAIEREGDYYIAKCVELGTSSFGRTQDEALANIVDATELYLDTLEDLGECGEILRDALGKGIKEEAWSSKCGTSPSECAIILS